MRLFLAINLPETIKKELAELQSEIKNSFPMEAADAVAKWVAPENLHLTLLFLGEVREGEISRLVEVVQKTIQGQPPFALKMKRICYGPGAKLPPRLIWVELEKNQQLEKMADDLRDACLGSGIGRGIGESGQEFVGHITLARVKEWVWKKIEPEEQPEIEKELDLKIQVRSIELMESRLKRSGPAYIVLQCFPLIGVD